jgi:eukaryotic-like serine/threonine-protein kinase
MKQDALLGRTIAGKYAIESRVGQGAMGAVYRARQTTLGTTLALKVLHQQLAGEPMFAARFLREAQAASRVDHPSSMRVVDFGEEPDGLLYIAMEYVDGKTLAQIIDEDGPLPVARIVDIACQTLAALAVAHDIGVIHRDIKPENIMVIEGQDDEGRTHDIVKVCDFGVAKLLEGGARGPSVTAEGLVIGTPEYMSPEQAQGEKLDARSDIYAMGVLLFHLMTGKVPFDSSTAFGTAFMHVNDEPTRPRLLNPSVDSRLEAICLKAMRKRPEDRHASARELRTELRALVGHDDVSAGAGDIAQGPLATGSLLQQIEGRPRRAGLVVAAVVVAACAGAVAIMFPRIGAPPPPLQEPVQSANVTSGVLPTSKPTPPALAEAPPPVGPSGDAPEAEAAASPSPSPRHVSAKSNARRSSSKARGGAAPSAAVDAVPQLPPAIAPGASATKPSVQASASAPADKPAAAKPAPGAKPLPGDKAASDKAASDKAASDKAASDEAAPGAKAGGAKPAGPKADPADAPLPVFPIPPPDPEP